METILDETFFSLPASVKRLLDNLVSSEFVDNFRSMKFDVSLLKNLTTTLQRVQAILAKPSARNLLLLYKLRYAVFEVEHFLHKITTEDNYCTPTQVLKNNSSPFNQNKCFSINYELCSINDRLQFLSSREQIGESFTSSVVVDESSIYGRGSDVKKLKHLLLSNDGDDSQIRVISIVGMVGIGKTTLASHLYNDPEVDDKFEVKVWVHISKHFDISRIFETILVSIALQTINSDNLNPQALESFTTKINYSHDVTTMFQNLLSTALQQNLNTKKFLLVLDDVRETKPNDWINLMDILNARIMGSRIIVTTRDERVGLSMKTFLYRHYLRPLDSEECWSLLARHAFGAGNNQQRSNLEDIGREIAKKCDGLPLAVVALGDLLRTELSPDYWNYWLESNIEHTVYKVHVSLKLSYSFLPHPLNECFAYCSFFPKKFILEKKMIVQLWVAEGLVESSTDQEKVGEEYFDELVSRSLLLRRYIGDEEANFEMHNLIHDSTTRCNRLDKDLNLFETIHNSYNLSERVNCLSYNRGQYDSYNKFDELYELFNGINSIGTFLALPLQEQLPLCLLSNKVVYNMLPRMKQLRVLSLSNYKSITEVPNSIANLLYLRYLNLSNTMIERLPSETCRLYNLQFLLLSGCKRLTELPKDMGKLVNLRHLDVSDTALKEMPVQIAELKNLQTLSDFVVSKHIDGLKVEELGKFPHLHGKLSISQLQNVNDPFEADQAKIKMKERIEELVLEWNCGSTFPDSPIQSVVLERLQPSTNLKSLTIKGYGGISFPNWLGDFLFRNMVYLRISNCDDCLWFPPLGQLGNLKKLIIEGMQSVETIGTELYGSDGSPSFQPFPSLETLHFENMQEWAEWNLIGGTAKEFPSLKTLSLSKCPKLRVGNIPAKFLSLAELELRECPLLVQSMPSSDHVFRQPVFLLNSLQQLTIDVFPSPMSFRTVGLPTTLKSLIISNCENLEFLPHEYLHHYTLLEELKISYSCNSMISFALGAFPVLKSLFIEGCRNLKSILIAEDGSQNSLSFLRSIKIWDCNELESFPPGGLHSPNLIHFVVWKCQKLQSLPEAMNTLTNLQEMEIDDLPNLQSFVVHDLPISLRQLTVGSVGGILWNTEPTWEHLTCLSVLRINGNATVNTLMVPLLPASLVTLCIRGLNNTSLDGKWRQHLTSLQNLEIVNAPKLKSLPKKGLPSSLLVLNMTFCPLLKEILRRKRGKEWSKIAHIPAIVIDDELIT